MTSVGVAHRNGQLRLTHKALYYTWSAQMDSVQFVERNESIEVSLAGGVNDSRATPTDLAQDVLSTIGAQRRAHHGV